MHAQDYKSGGILGDGILSGLGVSVLAHVAVSLLFLTVLSLMPARREPLLPLCTVNLISAECLSGNTGEVGMTKLAGGAKASEARSGPEAMIVPESKPEQYEIAKLPDTVEDTVPLVPLHKKVEKPKEIPKPKSPAKRPRTARTEPPAPIAPKEDIQSVELPGGNAGGIGDGSGRGTPEGAGKGNKGIGAGSGMGSFDTAFGAGDGPRFVTRVTPRYPTRAKDQRKEGTVLLSLTIDERGRLLNVEILKGAGLGFDEEAVRAVRASAFAPATRNGERVKCRAQLPIRFVLQGY
ncbi:MAG: TonB family protein [Syntrophobacteraceae bacterium]